MAATPFLGPLSVSRSPNFADNRLINLFPEVDETKSAKGAAAFYMTPGLDLLTTCGVGPVRGTEAVGVSFYVVSGSGVYSAAFGAVKLLGTIGTSSGPVSIINNGIQIAIFDGIGGWLIEAGALSPIALPFSGSVSASFQDGFGLVNQSGTNVWWQSNLFDLSTWAPLNFSSADSAPDSIIAIKSIHREVWLIKEKEAEIWINAGLPGFAFQRLEGVYPEAGIVAPFSLAKAGESLIWLANSSEGQGIVVMTSGYQTNRISTHPVEYAIAQIAKTSTIADAWAFAYQQEGHLFYVLNFPSGNLSLVYDVTESALGGISMWHQRAAFADGQLGRWWATTHTLFSEQNIVGDYRNGNLYVLNMNTQLDNGTQRKWLRSWRALPQPTMSPVRFSQLQIDMETGIGVASDDAPLCQLRWSDDGGHVWRGNLVAAAGKTGETTKRVLFRRLGSTRRDSGLDRIFELSSTDAFDVALMGADLQ